MGAIRKLNLLDQEDGAYLGVRRLGARLHLAREA